MTERKWWGVVSCAALMAAGCGGGGGGDDNLLNKLGRDSVQGNIINVDVGSGASGGDVTEEVLLEQDGLSGDEESSRTLTFTVPGDVDTLVVTLAGGSGDADLFVTGPAGSFCSSLSFTSDESCVLRSPESGQWTLEIQGFSAYSGVSAEVVASRGALDQLALQERTGLSGTEGDAAFYDFDAPDGLTSLLITLSGGEGDADLFVEAPDGRTCASQSDTSDEQCGFDGPAAGTYLVDVTAFTDYSGVSLSAVGFLGDSRVEVVRSVPDLAGAESSERVIPFVVPDGADVLTVTLTGGTAGSGDADLGIVFDTASPNRETQFDCVSTNVGNEEVCFLESPAAGQWQALVFGFSAFDGVRFDASVRR